MQERKCRYCGALFDHRHGNAMHCTPECAYETKKDRSRKEYARYKPYSPLVKNDKLLEGLYQDGQTTVSRDLLRRLGFDPRYHVYKGNKDGEQVLIMGKYGISAPSKSNYKIHVVDNGTNQPS